MTSLIRALIAASKIRGSRFLYVLGSGPIWEETFRIEAETRRIRRETADIWRDIDRSRTATRDSHH